MKETRKIVIVGDSAFAEIAYEYFKADGYAIAAFSVEKKYLTKDSLFGVPVVPFETLTDFYDPEEHLVFVAIVYTKLNRLRSRLAGAAKAKGYKLASYISKDARVWPNAKIGEHCFIFENNVIQPFVEIGDNVILWSGNHIGHHSKVMNNCFIASHVVISGFTEIGENSFLGVNTTVSNNIMIGKDNWIGPGITLTKDTEEGALFGPTEAKASKVKAPRFFKV